MGDVITCTAVLVRSNSPEPADRCDLLYLDCFDGKGLRVIPCSPAGADGDKVTDRPLWRYEERDGRLHLTPSLHATDSGFHTDYHWSCAFEQCPQEVGGYQHFKSINPQSTAP